MITSTTPPSAPQPPNRAPLLGPAAALAVALLASGCTTYLAQVGAGPAWSTRSPGAGATSTGGLGPRDPIAVEVSVDAGEFWGLGMATVLRSADRATEWALGAEAYYVHAPWVVSPIVRAGVRAVSLGSVDGAFSFGALSPYANAGLLYFFDRGGDTAGGWYLGLQGSMELAVRFTGQPAEAYGGAMLSVGMGLITWERHIRAISDEVL